MTISSSISPTIVILAFTGNLSKTFVIWNCIWSVVVLEFELRRAKETIKELRENITEYAQGRHEKTNLFAIYSEKKEIELCQ